MQDSGSVIMGDDDKPFACPMLGCGKRFTNEDHLTVHKRKHEMSLNLNSSITLKTPVVDQTPTPTRFLRSLEEVGLFQDLPNDNPFDEQFRKAAQSGVPINIIPETPLPTLSVTDTLNTPSIPPVRADHDLTVSTTTTSDVGDDNSSDEREVILPDDAVHDNTSSMMTFASSVEPASTTTDSDDDEVRIVSTSVTETTSRPVIRRVTATSKTIQAGTSRGVVQIPVITSVGRSNGSNWNATSARTGRAGEAAVAVVSKAGSPAVTTLASTITQVPVISTSGVHAGAAVPSILQPTNAVASGPMIQLILKLPDDQSVQIPVVNFTSAPARNPTLPSAPVTNRGAAGIVNCSVAKMKLKAALSQKSGTPADGIQQNVPRIIPAKTNGICSASSLYVRMGPVRRRQRDPSEDPDEKRRKFLERNRAAATRCRERRKQWIQALERKADELTTTNVQLQNEVAMLRNEVANLKSMLLAHKDCPITRQQRAAGQPDAMMVTRVATAVPVRPQTILTSATVDESSRESASPYPLAMELVEVEVSSSHKSVDDDATRTTSGSVGK